MLTFTPVRVTPPGLVSRPACRVCASHSPAASAYPEPNPQNTSPQCPKPAWKSEKTAVSKHFALHELPRCTYCQALLLTMSATQNRKKCLFTAYESRQRLYRTDGCSGEARCTFLTCWSPPYTVWFSYRVYMVCEPQVYSKGPKQVVHTHACSATHLDEGKVVYDG